MSDGDCLLAAILANPDDDTARLVFADWLEEHGQQERAEFIHVQIQLALRASEEPKGKAPMELLGHRIAMHETQTVVNAILEAGPCRCMLCLQKRADKLFANRCREWFANPTDHEWKWLTSETPGAWEGSSLFRRGFVESVTCSAADWLKHGDALRAQQPVTHLTLTTWPDWDGDEDDTWLAGDPLSRRIPWVDVRAEQSPEERDDYDRLLPAVIRCRWRGLKVVELPR